MGRRGGRGRGRRKPEESASTPTTAAPKRMLMNVIDPGEVRVAILGKDGLEEVYIEREGGRFNHGNIFKGKVQNVEPSLQAAFIDIGGEKNGFLHISDVIPPFGGYDDILKRRRKKAPEDLRGMSIGDMLYKGQEVLVQITREQLDTKGPSLTTYVSIPGRYLVLMPAVSKRGVSRKITDDKERDQLKKALSELKPPKDMGFIIRTAGMGRGKEELQHDLNYLTRLWETLETKAKKTRPPAPLYQESDLVIRAIRDYLYDDVEELLIDGKDEHARALEFLQTVMPQAVEKTRLYEESDPLFHRYGVEAELDRIFARSVRLKSGGEILVEQTEAMVTIDVNTGRFRGSENSRDMILSINKEAAVEVARQLRLRDLGGLIMIDFIDMDRAEDRRAVEETLRKAMERDRARVTMLPISALGVMEMTRQRVRKSLKGTMYAACPHCAGTGLRKNPENLAMDLIRTLRARLDAECRDLDVRMHPDTALAIANARRSEIVEIERQYKIRIRFVADTTLPLDEIRI